MKLNTRIVLIGIVLVIGLSLAAVTVIGQTTSPPGLEPEPAGVTAGDGPAAAESLERSVVAGGPGFVMVNPFQFRPYSSTTQWAYDGVNLYNPGEAQATYMAPLTLPNNVTITQLVAYYYDNAAGSITVDLMRCPVATSVCYGMASVSSSGASTEYRYGAINVISNPVIDQQSTSYLLMVRISGSYSFNLRLSGARIDYANTTYLPLLQK